MSFGFARKRARYDGSALTQMSQPYSQTFSTIGNASSVSKGKRKVGRPKGSNKLVRLIKTVIHNEAEKKEISTSLLNTYGATQSTVIALNLTSQGSGGAQRIGVETTHAYVEVSIGIYCLAPTTGNQALGDFGFWAIVLDRQPNGALAAFTDIFDDTITGQQGLDMRTTLTNQDRFKILSRNEFSIGSNGTYSTAATSYGGATGAAPYHVKEFIDMSKMRGADGKANFTGSGGTITAIDSGALLFVCACSRSTNNLTVESRGVAKYRFTDV